MPVLLPDWGVPNVSSNAVRDEPRGPRFAINGYELLYKYPHISIDSGSDTVEHKLIDRRPLIQHLGPTARNISVRGHCYLEEANVIDALSRRERIRLRSHRYIGKAVVESASTEPEAVTGGKVNQKRYLYRLELLEILDSEDGNEGNELVARSADRPQRVRQ